MSGQVKMNIRSDVPSARLLIGTSQKGTQVPEIGEIKRGKEIGKRSAERFIYTACIDCGKARWVVLMRGLPLYSRCLHCAVRTPEHRKLISDTQKVIIGDKRNNWRGGVRRSPKGYIELWVHPDDFYAPMANKHHYCFEHRLVMAKHLGRCLFPWEIVHHINGVRNDNRLVNLLLLPSAGYHTVDLSVKSRIKYLLSRVDLLESVLTLHNIPFPKNGGKDHRNGIGAKVGPAIAQADRG